MSATGDAFHTDRQLGWLMSLGGVVLAAGQTLPAASHEASFAPWWNVLGVVMVAGVVLVALVGMRLPASVLRGLWWSVVVLCFVLQATTYSAFDGRSIESLDPWVWTMEPVAVTYCILLVRPAVAVTMALLAACTPALSGVLVHGHVPAAVAVNTPIHLGNIVFVVIFLGIRSRLTSLRTAERDAAAKQARRSEVAAVAQRQQELARLVHDDVLSVLAAGMKFQGRPPPVLAAEAATALRVLAESDDIEVVGDEPPVAGDRAAAHLRARVRRIDPACTVEISAEPGAVPASVLHAVEAALAEAVRNSVNHAGPSSRRVEGWVRPDGLLVVVRDDGIGFDPDRVDATRQGLSQSIVGRMVSLPGGACSVTAAVGVGVEVRLSWTR